MVILIDTSSTDSGIALELLHIGFRPTPKRSKISKGFFPIVVRVPQLMRCHGWTCTFASEDCLPHVCGCIDPDWFVMGFYSVEDLGKELAVAVSIMAGP